MTILKTIYASAPADEVLIPSLEILTPSPQRICAGFENLTLGLETGGSALFYGRGIDVSLPGSDTSGQQRLTFVIDNVAGIAQQQIDAALDADTVTPVIYRSYLSSDLLAPAETPLRLSLVGGGFEGSQLTIQCAYYNLLTTAWPRERYTAAFAPGLKYFG